jgi:predicted AlkP superfamily pyrophosphatase or phosphodiesterase
MGIGRKARNDRSQFILGRFESDAGGTRPSYYYPYHEKFSDDDKVKIIKNWLQLPEEKRPHFITLYFPEVDHEGHHYGPMQNKLKMLYIM